MNKAVLLILTGTLALLTESCSIFTNFADSSKELEENAVKPVPVQVDTSSKANLEETEAEFADLEEEVEPVSEIAGLIPATNPDIRVRSIVRGRNDPFSIVTLNPRIEIEQEQKKQQVNTQSNSRSVFVENEEESNIESNIKANIEANINLDNEANLSPPEPIAEPTLAQDVIISGLYEANGKIKLIVQAPEENTSRYVEVGQYLSNGQVLVKSINPDNFPYPLVILEQSGIEVAKTIGGSSNDDDDIASFPTTTPDGDWLSSISLNSN